MPMMKAAMAYAERFGWDMGGETYKEEVFA